MFSLKKRWGDEIYYLDLLYKINGIDFQEFKLGTEELKKFESVGWNIANIDYAALALYKELGLLDVLTRKFSKLYVKNEYKELSFHWKQCHVYDIIEKNIHKIRPVLINGMDKYCKEFFLISDDYNFLSDIKIERANFYEFSNLLYTNGYINGYKWEELRKWYKTDREENFRLHLSLKKFKLLFHDSMDFLYDNSLFDTIIEINRCIFMEKREYNIVKKYIELRKYLEKGVEELDKYINTRHYCLYEYPTFSKNECEEDLIILDLNNFLSMIKILHKDMYLSMSEYDDVLNKLKEWSFV